MKKLLLLIALLVSLSATGFSQAEGQSGQGYVFFAPGVSSGGGGGFAHFGGGGEVLFKRVGVGGEIGYATPWQSFADGIGLLSANMSYNVRPGRVSPFVTGGYT